KLKHSLEPEVQYLFVPNLHRSFDTVSTTVDCGKLPNGVAGQQCKVEAFGAGYLFDQRDAINRRNFISYGLTSRLLGRAAGPPPAPGPAPAGAGAAAEAAAPIISSLEAMTVPQGLPGGALAPFVGPPAPPAAPAPGQPAAPPPKTAPRELARVS